MNFSRLASGALSAGLLAALAGCAVGPNFKRPAAPAATGFGTAPVQGETAAAQSGGGGAQRFVAGMNIPSQWWTLFQSQDLNHLVEQALKGNPDVGAAQAALRQAHELYLAQRSTRRN
jgi:outer membrane protein TolC